MGVLLDEERTATRELRQNLKKAEATIAYLNTRLSVIESGSRDKDEATSATKWDTERQQLRDEIARAQREERRAKQERDDDLETVR